MKVKVKRTAYDSVTRKVNLAVEDALSEHKRKNVPAIILDSADGIIYEVYSDGSRRPIKKRDKSYVDRVLSS